MKIITAEDGLEKFDFTGMDLWGIDIETFDPYLKKKATNTKQGTSWIFNEGRILYTGVYNLRTGEKRCVKKWDESVKNILLNDNAVVIGHNFGYDLGWLEHDMKIKMKAHILDSVAAEALIDEYGLKDLDHVGRKYVGRGKKKYRLDEWAAANGKKGDVRQYLDEAPPEFVEEYVVDDAEVSALVLVEQLRRIYAQKLIRPFDIDCRLIKVVNYMKQVGFRVDRKKKEANFNRLNDIFQVRKEEFFAQYGKMNLTSPKQLQQFCDREGIPYRYKIRVKGKSGAAFADARAILNDVKKSVAGFSIKKKECVSFVSQAVLPGIKRQLDAEGFIYTANPSLDKYFLEPAAKKYTSIAKLAALRKMNSTLTKFLGPKFDRFIADDDHIHGTFNVSKSEHGGTISGRLSASDPNLQQVQSKGEAEDMALAELCREIFIAEENCWLLKIDYSQIEYRLLVHYARGPGAELVRQKFRDNPYTDYHKFVMVLTGLERKYAKNCNFGIMYGMQIKGMMEAFGWTEEDARRILDTYHDAMPFVKTTIEAVSKRAIEKGYITTVGGRRARLKNENLSYTMLNRLNQGGSADIMKTAMVMAWDDGIFDILIPHVTVHDELVCSVPKTWEGLDAVKRLRNVMEHAIELNIPIIAEPELGKDWYHVDTRYARETSKGIELVGAERFTEGSEAKPVKTKKGVVMFEEGKVLLRDLDGNEAVVTESFFDKNFKEVA